MDRIVDQLRDERRDREPARRAAAGDPSTSWSSDGDARVDGIRSVTDLPLWVNGGYFVLRQEIFDVLGEGEDLVGDAFAPPRRASASSSPFRYTGSGRRWTR